MAGQSHKRIWLVAGIGVAGCLAALLISGYEDRILHWLQHYQAYLTNRLELHPILGRVVFIFLFILFIGCYLPGGIFFLLLSGALLPFWEGFVVASLANALGATLGLLLARNLLRERFRKRFSRQFVSIDEGWDRHGKLYLLLLRVAPVVPSPVVNAVMGLTRIAVPTYFWITLLGRVPMTVLYVRLGKEFASIDTLSELLSTKVVAMLGALCLLILCGHIVARRLRLR